MMLGAILIALAGFLLIYLEFYLPGGIMGITGGVLLFANIVYFAIRSPSLFQLFILVAATIVGLVVIVKLALNRIKTAKPGEGVYHDDDQEGYCASSYNEEMVGKEGKALSNLSPSGHIIVHGNKLQALSRSGFIAKDTEIVVIGGQGAHLIIKKNSKEER